MAIPEGSAGRNDSGGGDDRPAAAKVVALDPQRHAAPLDRLLARFGTRLRALVQQHCRDGQGLDPDDIEQEVRIRLWKSLQRDPDADFPASYIQRVVVSTVIDGLRRRQARPAEPLPDESDEPALYESDDAPPEARASGRQRLDRLLACLAALPDRRRVVVELHLQGFTPQEVGELTGNSFDAARKLIERGLKDLRARLAAHGIEAGE